MSGELIVSISGIRTETLSAATGVGDDLLVNRKREPWCDSAEVVDRLAELHPRSRRGERENVDRDVRDEQ